MTILHIEHPVSNFDAWKKAFDSDPVGRAKSGVNRYQISRAVNDPNYVVIDLEFDNITQAEGLLAGMRIVWGRVEGAGLIGSPRVRMLEPVENKEVHPSLQGS